jgi:hypothetical protein
MIILSILVTINFIYICINIFYEYVQACTILYTFDPISDSLILENIRLEFDKEKLIFDNEYELFKLKAEQTSRLYNSYTDGLVYSEEANKHDIKLSPDVSNPEAVYKHDVLRTMNNQLGKDATNLLDRLNKMHKLDSKIHKIYKTDYSKKFSEYRLLADNIARYKQSN